MWTGVLLVDALLRGGLIRCGLVVSGEYITHISRTAQVEIDGFMDQRLPCLTVGDAGAAVVLARSPSPGAGFHDIDLYTLGRYSPYCIAKVTSGESAGAIMHTDALKLSSVALQSGIAHSMTTLERQGWSMDSFQHLILHQTSETTLRDAAREINRRARKDVITDDVLILNLLERGNTATTTHFVALMDHIRSGRIGSGDRVVFGLSGSGLTLGTALYVLDDLPERIRSDAPVNRPAPVARGPRSARAAGAATRGIRVESIGTVPPRAAHEASAVDLGRQAAQSCLRRSSIRRRDLDLLIYAGVYREEYLCEPAVATLLAGDLGINDDVDPEDPRRTLAFDIINGALGTMNACHIGATLLRMGMYANVMVVAAEIENNAANPARGLRGVAETGSAFILSASGDGTSGFVDFHFKDFSSHLDAFNAHTCKSGSEIHLTIRQDTDLNDLYIRCIDVAVREMLDVAHLKVSDLRLILPPQVSSSFIARLGAQLRVGEDRLVDAVRGDGDLFTSSIAYGLLHAQESGRVQPGDLGLVVSVGTGIQVGCALYRF
jgi:3-oxoacyl-[acyl-carrier-protein] synthase III